MALTKERKIILAVGVLLLAIGALYRFAPDVTAILGDDEEILLARRNIQKYRARADQMDAVQRAVRQARTNLERSESILLDGQTEALAAVHIQNIVKQIASATGIEVDSTRVLKAEKMDFDRYQGVRVEIRFKTTIKEVNTFIYKVENHDQWLAIQSLNMNVPSAKNPEAISVKMVVMGLMKKV